jgi:hypothetical protein
VPCELIEVLGAALELWLVLIDVLGAALELCERVGDALVLNEVLGEALALVLIDVLGLGDGLVDWSLGPHAMMWLMPLSPSWPPGSKTPLPLVSAQTVSPEDALANNVLV